MPYLEDVKAESPTDTFNFPSNWEEAIDERQPGGGDTFSAENAEAVIVVETTPNKIRSMLRKVLGFSAVKKPDGGLLGGKLFRENPVRHPRYPWMRASAISFSQFPPDASNSTLKQDAVFPVGGIPSMAKYQLVYATVRFRSWRCKFLTDSEVNNQVPANEFFRNVYFDPASSIEMLSAEGPLGQMQWNQGGGANEPPIVAPANKIAQPFGTLVSKSVYVMNWLMVPHELISFTSYPECKFTKIESIVGRVNSAAFGPYPGGTLLCQPPKYTPYAWNVSTQNGVDVFMGWDIQIPFQFFDPERGRPLEGPRGYDLLPWAPTLKWFDAVRADGATHLLNEADFNVIFERPTS